MKKSSAPLFLSVLLASAAVGQVAGSGDPLDPAEAARVQAAAALIASVVQVNLATPTGTSTAPSGVSSSGFLWDDAGHVVTTASWLGQGAASPALTVTDSKGRRHSATIVGVDPMTRVAVLQIEAHIPGALPVGSAKDMVAGRTVLSVGNPFGLSGSLSVGVVSGVDRVLAGDGQTFTGMLQTTTPVNPGDAGGPVTDSSGRLIGMAVSTYGRSPRALTDRVEDQLGWLDENRTTLKELSHEARAWWEKTLREALPAPGTPGAPGPKEAKTMEEEGQIVDALFDKLGALAAGVKEYGVGFLGKDMDFLGAQGISFVLPVEQVSWVVGEILSRGAVEHGWLGVTVTGFPDTPGEGARVFELQAGGTADRSGLKMGDVIRAFDERPVAEPADLFAAMFFTRAGETHKLTVLRPGAAAGEEARELVVEILLQKRPGAK